MKRLIVILLISVTAFLVFIYYTTPDTPIINEAVAERNTASATPFDAVVSEYEQYIKESLALTGTPGAAVAIVKDSLIVFLKGFGVRNVEKQDSVDAHTIFRLASVSKPVSATLAGILVEDSILHWQDPVTKYIAGFDLSPAEFTDALQLRHVLSQSTGFPYHTYTNLIEDGRTLADMLNELHQVELIAQPGKVYSYQNVAYSILDSMVSKATNSTFEQAMKAHVFGPLFMADASLTYDDIISRTNVAQPHLYRGRQWKPIPISDTYYNAAPAGGINASITDMAKWMVAMLGYRSDVISPGTIEQLYSPHVKATAKNRNFNRWSRIKRSYYGLGWRVIQFQEDTLAYHGGYVNGYRSEVAIHPSKKIAICVLANGPSGFSDYALPSFFRIYDKHMKTLIDSVSVIAP